MKLRNKRKLSRIRSYDFDIGASLDASYAAWRAGLNASTVRTWTKIFDPAYADLFSADAARRAFQHLGGDETM